MSEWSIQNVRDLKWYDSGPRGHVAELVEDEEAQVGVNLFVLEPGQPQAMYHFEADQEGFLVLAGEAILIIDGEERTIKQWDYVHCPPGVAHTRIGGGTGPCVILAVGARAHQAGDDWGAYPVSELAAKYDASSPEETSDAKVAYARFPKSVAGEFRDEWFPS